MNDDLTIEYQLGDDETTPPTPGPAPRNRRKVAGLALLAALVGGAVAGALLIGSPVSKPEPPKVLNPLPAVGTAPRIELDRAGLSGPVGGSLGENAAALEQIRNQVATLSAGNDHTLTTPARVLVLWAGDLDSGRYAVAVFPRAGGWSSAVLTGPAGAPAGKLTEAVWDDDEDQATDLLMSVSATFIAGPGRHSAGAALVVAPHSAGVRVATGRQFLAGGGTRTTYRPLAKQGGMVWAGELSQNELYLADYATKEGGGSFGDFADDPYPQVVGDVDAHAAVDAIASGPAARTEAGRNVLNSAADMTKAAGASLAEKPALAVAATLDKTTTVGVVVLRSPDGGWVWGLCDTETDDHGDQGFDTYDNTAHGVAAASWTDPAQAMVAAEARTTDTRSSSGEDGPPRYVVLAPSGADHIRIAGHTAPVTARLAEITLPRKTSLDDLKIEALRNGKVVGTTTPQPTS